MTNPDCNADPADHGQVVAGALSAGTTTVLRHLRERVTVGELVRADPAVQALLQGNPGARS